MKKPLYGFIALTLIVAAVFGAAELYDYKIERERKAILQEKNQELIDLAHIKAQPSFHEKVDTIRDFIFTVSIHKIDDEFRSYWRDTVEMTDIALAYAKGERKEPVHAECSSRTGLMQNMLKYTGFKTRVIFVAREKKNFPGHVFLEVYNPETEKWEVQDPDYNVYWTVDGQKDRASIHDLIKNPLEKLIPCTVGNVCGKDIKARHRRPYRAITPYLGIASVQHKESGTRPLLVNTKRFDLERPVTDENGKSQTYCQRWAKNCRDEIIRY